MGTQKERFFAYARETYGTEPDAPFATAPTYRVLRHRESKKWYALVMDVPRERLGLAGDGSVDILNIKCDPALSGVLRMGEGYLPAYHMNRDNWITVLLDGTVPEGDIYPLLDISYKLTGEKQRRGGAGRIMNWLIPANPRYFDIDAALADDPEGVLEWKQSSSVAEGDTVYIYMAAPVSAILYKCRALEVDIPHRYSDGNVRMTRTMRLKFLQRYGSIPIGRDLMKKHGVFAVRGPRSMPNSLIGEIDNLYKDGGVPEALGGRP